MCLPRTWNQVGRWRQTDPGAFESHRGAPSDGSDKRFLIVIAITGCKQFYERGLPRPQRRQYVPPGDGPADQRHRDVDQPPFKYFNHA